MQKETKSSASTQNMVYCKSNIISQSSMLALAEEKKSPERKYAGIFHIVVVFLFKVHDVMVLEYSLVLTFLLFITESCQG